VKTCAVAAIALAFVACQLDAVPAGAQAAGDDGYLVLTGGRLIDGRGNPPVVDAAVIVRGGRIAYAGPADSIEIPTGARVIDVGGRTILPGLINAHVHRGTSVPILRAWAHAGVTTVRDLGVNPESLFTFREQNALGPAEARLVAAGPLLTVPGGYPIVPFGSGSALALTSLADTRAQAERLLDGGVDLLKLALETGTIFGRRIPVMSLAQASLLVRIAHGRGTVASAHITSVVDLDLALDAGVDDLAHMAVDAPVPADVLQRIVAQDVVWVPTLELWSCTAGWQREMAVANLDRFVRAGGRVALGTDYEGYTCRWDLGLPATEIGLMAQAGMSPMQILVAATREAARVCNLGQDLGTLEKGKIADLIVVDGDPLASLDTLRDVVLVLRDGVVIRSVLPAPGDTAPRKASGRVHPG